jgi:membrane protease YdiL (CAAX protease family)
VTAAGPTRAALAATVGALVVGMGLRSTVVPGGAHLWFNLVLAGLLLLIARWAQLSADELGLARGSLGSGLRWGLGVLAVIAAVVTVAAIVPATSTLFEDDRADVSAGALLVKVLIEIPIGTVLLEELAFRGVLLGLLRRRAGPPVALALSAVLFGCWHIVTAWSTASQNAALDDVASSTAGRVGAVIGTVVVTTIAGLGFGWLRLRSRSLIAPMLAHLATNSVAFVAAWSLAR